MVASHDDDRRAVLHEHSVTHDRCLAVYYYFTFGLAVMVVVVLLWLLPAAVRVVHSAAARRHAKRQTLTGVFSAASPVPTFASIAIAATTVPTGSGHWNT